MLIWSESGVHLFTPARIIARSLVAQRSVHRQFSFQCTGEQGRGYAPCLGCVLTSSRFLLPRRRLLARWVRGWPGSRPVASSTVQVPVLQRDHLLRQGTSGVLGTGRLLAPGRAPARPAAAPLQDVPGAARPSMETVVLPRSAEIDEAEAALRWSLVAFASGPRVSIPLAEASAVIPEKVPRAVDNFTVYRHWPSDFLVVCSSRRVRETGTKWWRPAPWTGETSHCASRRGVGSSKLCGRTRGSAHTSSSLGCLPMHAIGRRSPPCSARRRGLRSWEQRR
jgi:hypothetical protein